MKKGLLIIVIGVMAAISIILALPFTPLRSSFQGIASNYVDLAFSKLGVDFNGSIKNAHAIVQSSQYDGFGLNFADKTSKKNSLKVGGDYNTNFENSGGSYNGIADFNANKNNGGGIGNEGVFSSSKSKNGSSGSNSSIASINIKSTSKDISQVTTGTIKQGATKQSYDTGLGGTHPGYDPIGNLPVGDGNYILLVFGLVFGLFRFRNSFYV